MKTIDLVKSKIESLDKKASYEEIEAVCPVVKRQRINDKMTYILQNPETLKFAVISDEQVEGLNDLFNEKKYGASVINNIFNLNHN